MKNIRLFVRIFFLGLILYLWYIGKTDIWGPLVFLGLLATPLFGRLYCGWLCPVSTSIDLIRPALPEPPLQKYVPQMLDKKVNAVLFLLMLGYIIFFIKTNWGIPFFILMIPFGIILTFFFSESCAHRNCLVGIIYSWLARFSRKTYRSNTETCALCLHCITVCPTNCLDLVAGDRIKTDKKNCLCCGKCVSVCPKNAIAYQTDKRPAGSSPNSLKKSLDI